MAILRNILRLAVYINSTVYASNRTKVCHKTLSFCMTAVITDMERCLVESGKSAQGGGDNLFSSIFIFYVPNTGSCHFSICFNHYL